MGKGLELTFLKEGICAYEIGPVSVNFRKIKVKTAMKYHLSTKTATII